ncbi:hypothetical protein [Halarchaeum sp. P4]|uniref:hypothetical protein n=1 Tax=Halarchaeum sp. P4 TaxID=3421639 RepID=UPI003EBCBD97
MSLTISRSETYCRVRCLETDWRFHRGDVERGADPTRPTTYGNPGWGEGTEGVIENIAKVAEYVDVLSCNYREHWYDDLREAGVDNPIVGSECRRFFRGHGDDPHAVEWSLPYEAGTLRAVAKEAVTPSPSTNSKLRANPLDSNSRRTARLSPLTPCRRLLDVDADAAGLTGDSVTVTVEQS